MTMRADGSGECDRCGKDLPNTGVAECVVVSTLLEDGEPRVFHLCTSRPDPCSSHVLTRAALAHRVASDGEAPRLHHREDPSDDPDA